MNQLATDGIAPTQGDSAYFTQVFAWMAAGLAVTGGAAAAVYSSGTALHTFEGGSGPTIFIILAVLELALVAGLVGLVQHMNLFEARATFIGYAALNGVTISVIFLAYTTSSIVSTFFVTAAMFGAVALWGYATKRYLTGWGTFLFMALFGQLVGLVVNLFWLNNTLYWVTTAVGSPALLRLHRLRRPAAQGARPAAARRRLRRRGEGRDRRSARALPRLRQPLPLPAADPGQEQAVARSILGGLRDPGQPLGELGILGAETFDLGALDGEDLAEGEGTDARRARSVLREQRPLADHRAGSEARACPRAPPPRCGPRSRRRGRCPACRARSASARRRTQSSEPTAASFCRSSSSTPPSIARPLVTIR